MLPNRSSLKDKIPCVYFLANASRASRGDLASLVSSVLAGGVGIVQWRALADESAEAAEDTEVLLELKKICARHAALFLINDDVALCRQIRADGVHLGQTDMPVNRARRQLGSSAVIGLTLHSELHAQTAPYAELDYVSIGCMFPSRTKPGLPVLGIVGARRMIVEVRQRSAVPIFCIGGIKARNIRSLRPLRPDGVVLFEGLACVKDPRSVAEQMCEELRSW